jgi:hypothetical protein
VEPGVARPKCEDGIRCAQPASPLSAPRSTSARTAAAPSALRVANLNKRLASIGCEVEDLGNIPVEQAESLPTRPDSAKYLPQIAATCHKLALQVEKKLPPTEAFDWYLDVRKYGTLPHAGFGMASSAV